ncbi:hypothetical protein KEM55_002115, partial [Ascosphaera atra]
NPNFVYTLLRTKQHFENLREFTIHHGSMLEQLVDPNTKKPSWSSTDGMSPRGSQQSDRHRGSLGSAHQLDHVPEEEAFAIGEDDSDDEEGSATQQERRSSTHTRSPPQSSAGLSRPSSIISTTDSVPQQLRGMSEKARGKMPEGQMVFARQNSSASLSSYAMAPSTNSSGFIPTSTWIDSWVAELPLHTPLAVISALMPHMPTADLPASTDPEGRTIISELPRYADDPSIKALIADRSAARVHTFEWSPMSLGWYESLLWGCIFTSEMVIGNKTTGSTPGAVGVWNGTAIKLFKVQEAAPPNPSLLAPRGAVDAFGNSIVQRLGNLSLSRNSSSTNVAHEMQPTGSQPPNPPA